MMGTDRARRVWSETGVEIAIGDCKTNPPGFFSNFVFFEIFWGFESEEDTFLEILFLEPIELIRLYLEPVLVRLEPTVKRIGSKKCRILPEGILRY